jgi:hypothetical protein
MSKLHPLSLYNPIILTSNFLVSIIIISYFHFQAKLTSAVLTMILHFFRFVVAVIDPVRHRRLKNVSLNRLKLKKYILSITYLMTIKFKNRYFPMHFFIQIHSIWILLSFDLYDQIVKIPNHS